MSDLVDPPTFYIHVKISLYFSKASLAMGLVLAVSRNVAQTRRSDSVPVYWTCMKCMNRLPKFKLSQKVG